LFYRVSALPEVFPHWARDGVKKGVRGVKQAKHLVVVIVVVFGIRFWGLLLLLLVFLEFVQDRLETVKHPWIISRSTRKIITKRKEKTVNRYYLDGGDVDLDDLRGGGTRVQQPSAQCFAHFRRQKRVLLRHLKGLVVVECFRWLVLCWVVYWVVCLCV
jgi:hypothetical protein